ncbi:alpha/beta fold hydrolase [Enhygromyxa salina]|nr:alpha/beta hydrolase [Enhygromyxa salina]
MSDRQHWVRHWVRRDDGARLYVRSLGAPSERPALLILDGIGCAGWAFRKLGPQLAQGSGHGPGSERQVVLMHYRGHGKSPSPPRPWQLGMHTLADDAAAVCDALGVGRVIALGFSMGFQVALEFYRRHRQRTAALISLAGPPGQPLASFRGTDAFSFALPLVVGITRVAQQMTRRVWASVLPSQRAIDFALRHEVNSERIDSRDFELYLRQMADMNPELFAAMLEQAQRHTAEDILAKIRVPTMVVAGARDEFVPVSRLRAMAFAIPGARWEVIEGATHALPAEFPNELAAHIASFLAELPEEQSEAQPETPS